MLFTVVEGEGVGERWLAAEGEPTEAPAELAAEVGALLRSGRSAVLEHEGRRVFADVYEPPLRLVVIGAVDTAEALCAAAKQLGWRTIVADARAKFATRERIPSADELVVGWPEEVFDRVGPDYATAVVVLTHDDRFDIPALRGRPRYGGLLHRGARLPPQPGATARAAAGGRYRRRRP